MLRKLEYYLPYVHLALLQYICLLYYKTVTAIVLGNLNYML